jgi:hypothetical protein
MSASAGVATAAYEGPAAAVRGEDAGAQAAIVIVCREPGAREILHRELSRRYGADYQILVCDRPAELAARMRDLRKAGLPVALVIGGVGAQDPDGIEVLAPVRRIDPTALRVAAVHWGDWESARSVFAADRSPGSPQPSAKAPPPSPWYTATWPGRRPAAGRPPRRPAHPRPRPRQRPSEP